MAITSVSVASLLFFLSASPVSKAQDPKKNEMVERATKGWQLADAAAKKLRYKVSGFTFGGGATAVPWRGKVSSGDTVTGRFSMMPMDDGTVFSRHYIDVDASPKARAALLQDWVKAAVIDAATAEAAGKAWEDLSARAKALQYAVTGYGVASGADKREAAVIWRAKGTGKVLGGLFSAGTEKGADQQEAGVESELDKAQRDALLKAWTEVGVLSADQSAAVTKAWEEASAKIAREGHTATMFGLTLPAGGAPSTKVAWRGKDSAGKFITGSY